MHQNSVLSRIFGAESSPLLLMQHNFDQEFKEKMAEHLHNFGDWDCDGCHPPVFDLPPPPKPPNWYTDEDQENCKPDFELLETCDNTIIINANFEDTFHSVAVIVVCSLILVIVLLVTSVLIFRRRKQNGQFISSFQHSDCHQINDNTLIYDNNGLTTTSDPRASRNNTARKTLTSALKRGGNVLNSVNSSSTFNLDNHFPNSQSLPNHYITESRKLRTLDPAIREDFQNRFRPMAGPRRNVMQLSTRAPPNENYPHILIGGQPFYLIPSNPDYDYANNLQQTPIYEEIDKVYSEYSSSGRSDQGEVGSVINDSSSLAPATTEHCDHHLLPLHQLRQHHHHQQLTANAFQRKMVHRSPHSIYYYSDTLRRDSPPPPPPLQTPSSATAAAAAAAAAAVTASAIVVTPKISDDSDSGISNRSAAGFSTPRTSDPVQTQLVIQNQVKSNAAKV